MLPLIKIRLTYLKTHKCSLFLTYILAPLMILLSIIIYVSNRDEHINELNGKKDFSIDYKRDLFSTYEVGKHYLTRYLTNCSLVSADREKGELLKNFLQREIPGIVVNLLLSEGSIYKKKTQNVIMLDYDKEKESYKFGLKQIYGNYYNYGDNQIVFHSDALQILDSIDLFNYTYENKDYYHLDYKDSYVIFEGLIAKFLIQEIAKKPISKNLTFELAYNSYPPSAKDPLDYINYNIIVIMFVCMVFTLIFMSLGIQMMEEKDLKLEKFLERYGIGQMKYMFSWMFSYFVSSLLSNIVIIIGILVIYDSYIFVAILNLLFWNLSQFFLMYLIMVISPNKKTGQIISSIFTFSTLTTGLVLTQLTYNRGLQLFLSIFPNINCCLSFRNLGKLQFMGEYKYVYTLLNYCNVSYVELMLMCIFSIVLFGGIGMFVRKYQNSGLSFCQFLRSFCVKTNRVINIMTNQNNILINQFQIHHEELSEVNKKLKEDNNYLEIRNVTRNYGGLIAVNDFSSELFKNEIFCLLGHNGAGKTTLIKMISGAEDPDNGDIFLNTHSLVTEKNYLYQHIGLCQQEDIFFDYLTVTEQLKYMMQIKGERSNPEEIQTLITKIGLLGQSATLCKNLSGGEKRKLCVALAIIGNSELILLDEPTSGMDVIAKRSLWEFLKEFKKDKIVILTTHSLEEAEYLGDRIGIMNTGQYICSGTSSYLKSKYPCGFYLNLILNPKVTTQEHKNQLYNQLIKYEPNLDIKISSKGLLSLNIQSNNQNIQEIFDIIENHKGEYGIEDYTVSSTTLEDVFIRLSHKQKITDEKPNLININQGILEVDNFQNVSSSSLFFPQLCAHIKRGFFALWRNKLYTFLNILNGVLVMYIYVFVYSESFKSMSGAKYDLNELLQYNDIFICESSEEFIKNSIVNEQNSINYVTIDDATQSRQFTENIYNAALGNIGKAGICLVKQDEVYHALISEIPQIHPNYFYADIMMVTSSYLKKVYNINAEIFGQLEYITDGLDFGQGISQSEIFMLGTLSFASAISVAIYIGLLTQEKIKERIKNIKHILYLSGANMWSYWCGFFVVDFVNMMIFIAISFSSIYVVSKCASYIWLEVVISTISLLPFIYFSSFCLSKEESGMKFQMIVFFIAFLLLTAIMNILIFGSDTDIKDLLSSFLEKYKYNFFDIVPLMSYFISYLKICFSYLIFQALSGQQVPEPFDVNGIKLYSPETYEKTCLLISVINLVIFVALIILLESGLIPRCTNYIKVSLCIKESNITFSNVQITDDYEIKNEEDNKIKDPLIGDNIDNNNIIVEDNNNLNNIIDTNENNRKDSNVHDEITKVNNDTEDNLTTKIIGLKKTYFICCGKNIRAVNNLYLGLDNTEKFGLLGFNGSGKTTTFKSITKEILFDSGRIKLFGHDTKTDFDKIRQSIGYCPQENPIFDYMKVKEIIQFYLELKRVNASVPSICEQFGLESYQNTYCINLSGGNKRKLSFALACMCKPRLLLLDEPSTGVDPESRRGMWKNILETSRFNQRFNMILTTHSMEEAEILCDTVSWLKSGSFVSIGNPEKLKLLHSAGYKLHIKFIKLDKDSDNLNNQSVENLAYEIKGLDKFRPLISENMTILPCLSKLSEVLNQIRVNCSDINLLKINKDLSFELAIHVLKAKQSTLFAQILNMKNTNNLISEISVSMESLENILTRL